MLARLTRSARLPRWARLPLLRLEIHLGTRRQRIIREARAAAAIKGRAKP